MVVAKNLAGLLGVLEYVVKYAVGNEIPMNAEDLLCMSLTKDE